MTFAAIDFETANPSRDSACAVAIVVVRDSKVVHREHYLIRPPTRYFVFTHLHGLTWEDVQHEPTFADVWSQCRPLLKEVEFLAAHNAQFDLSVLKTCCTRYQLRCPKLPFVCTVKVARQVWDVFPTRLPNVCRHLRIPLQHHRADSDAEACARIILAARKTGWRRQV